MAQTKSESGAAAAWTYFASTMMIMLGVWWILAGIAGVLKDDIFVLTAKYVFKFNVTTWGWIHLVLGVVVLLAGFGILQGAVWARTVGVITAVASGIIAFAWLPYYPVWGAIFIAASVFVIWALTAHGGQFKE
jgi:hypothetical protein